MATGASSLARDTEMPMGQRDHGLLQAYLRQPSLKAVLIPGSLKGIRCSFLPTSQDEMSCRQETASLVHCALVCTSCDVITNPLAHGSLPMALEHDVQGKKNIDLIPARAGGSSSRCLALPGLHLLSQEKRTVGGGRGGGGTWARVKAMYVRRPARDMRLQDWVRTTNTSA